MIMRPRSGPAGYRRYATPSARSAASVGPITSPGYKPISCRICALLLLGCLGALRAPLELRSPGLGPPQANRAPPRRPRAQPPKRGVGNQFRSRSICTWHSHSGPAPVCARARPAGARPGFLLFVFGARARARPVNAGPAFCQLSPHVAIALPRYSRPVPIRQCAPRAPPEVLLQPPQPLRACRTARPVPAGCLVLGPVFEYFDSDR